MTYIAKAALFCDKCGARVDCEPSPKPPMLGTILADTTELAGWMTVEQTHHLCPKCAEAYRRKQKELDDELKRFAGIKQISFDL